MFTQILMLLESEIEIRHRLVAAGLMGAGALSLIAILFGYFRLNHASRGFYNRRLQTLAAGLLIAVAVILYLVYLQLV